MSFNYNRSTLVGRLTKDPELRQFGDATKAMFSLAVNRPYQRDNGEVDTDFIPVSMWGRMAELAQAHLKKGSPILVEGRIQVRQYEKNGQSQWHTEVQADNFQILAWMKDDSELGDAAMDKLKSEAVGKKK